MIPKRKSILRSTEGQDPKKRLSFAATPEKKTGEQRDVTQSVPGYTSAFGNSSCVMTPFGMCYKPKATPRELQGHDSIPMKESQRNVFASVLNLPTSSEDAVEVMIVGEEIMAEKFKMYLLDAHSRQHTNQSLKRRMNLNITCDKDFTSTTALKTHFVIILFFMDTHESLRDLSSVLQKCRRLSVPSKKIMVLSVSSAEGCFKNAVDLERFHRLLESYQVIHLTWKEKGRIDEMVTKIMLDLIHKSAASHTGACLLTDYVLQVDVKDWLVEDSEPQDQQ